MTDTSTNSIYSNDIEENHNRSEWDAIYYSEYFGLFDTPRYEFTNDASREVWQTTYSANSSESSPHESDFNSTFMRVAKHVGINESKRTGCSDTESTINFIKNLFSKNQFIPGGRILSNIGLDYNGATLLNCFVSPKVDYDMDSIVGISKILEMQMSTLKSEGGWGFNASFIRPNGSFIAGIGGQSPGAVKFLEIFDKSSEVITQGTTAESKDNRAKKKIRKGAQMAILDVWHPDIREFITAKQTPGRLQKFNMSVNITDKFMNQLKNYQNALNSDASKEEIEKLDIWELIFPDVDKIRNIGYEIQSDGSYIENGEPGDPNCTIYKKEWFGDIKLWIEKGLPVKVFDHVKCSELWDLIMRSTYNRNEPGVVFLDRANDYNPANYAETIVATNPCGEQTLSFANVCCVGSIDLTSFYDITENKFNWVDLKWTVRYAVDFLDNIIDIANPPLKEYRDSLIDKRRIAIGTMGFASLMYLMGIRYGSETANSWITKIQKFIATEAYKRSIELAETLGKFKLCDPEKHAEGKFIKSLDLPEDYIQKLKKFGIRNSALTSIQPTGNTAFANNIKSSGCEPIFFHEYIRTMIINHSIPDEIKPYLPPNHNNELIENEYFKFIEEGDDKLLRGEINGVVYKIDLNRGLTKEVLCEDYAVHVLKKHNQWKPNAEWAVTALELPVSEHCESLKLFSQWLDSACSKTINIPNDYDFEDFKNIYMSAYDSKYIRGITTYRAGTMANVLAKVETPSLIDEEEEIILTDEKNVKLHSVLPAEAITLEYKGDRWYLTMIFKDDDKSKPFTFFVNTVIEEHEDQTHDAVDRLIELARTKGIPFKFINKTIVNMCNQSNSVKIALIISLCLRHGILIKNIITELNKIQNIKLGSFLYHIKKFLSIYIKDGTKVDGVKCDNCGSENVIFIEGCFKCISCDTSKCS